MPKLPLIDPENPPRTKTKAAAASAPVSAVVVFVLRQLGVNVDDVPPEVLIFVGGSVAAAFAFLKRDGLRGAWQRVVNGQGDA